MYNDKAIIHAIKNNDDRLDNCFTYLYKNVLPRAINYFKKKGANEEEIRDLFQEAVIVFHDAVKEGRFEQKASISTFLFRVINNMWINTQKKERKNVRLNDDVHPVFEDITEQEQMTNDNKELVKRFMGMLKTDCINILTFFYYKKMPMHEIAKEMGYKNEQIARNKKSRCLKALQKVILTNKKGI